MTTSGQPRLLFVVNVDWFFLSHRLPLALACQRAGFDVRVCAAESGRGDEIRRAGLEFIPLALERAGTRPLQEMRTLAALVDTYRRVRPDIVHQVTIKPVIYGSLAARALGIRGVVNAVSGLGYAFIQRAEDRLSQRALRKSLWMAYRLALDGPRTRVIFQNHEDQSTFVQRGLVAAERTALIRGSGVDFTQFVPTPLPDGEFTAVLPARLLWDKGIGEFVEAATRLKKAGRSARFVLLGPVDAENPAAIAREQVERWVESGVVEWWGHADRRDMPGLLARAHVIVLPSYREGLPLALAEAAASGRACISTDVPGCRDVVEHGVTGWLVPVRDAAALESALEEAMRDRVELRRRGEQGATMARTRFGLDSVVRQTLGIYQALLGVQDQAGRHVDRTART